uniref:Zinc finger Y-chromosomal protein n=1 Tax=Cacopsylla melanoneura TaxID=428564 RepID=A0A8D8PRJ6_9HEMI
MLIVKLFTFVSHFFPDLFRCKDCKQELLADLKCVLDHCKMCKCMSRPFRNTAYRFVCFECDYHSRYESQMKIHVLIHFGEKPFKCKYCSFASGRQFGITSHIKIKHRT